MRYRAEARVLGYAPLDEFDADARSARVRGAEDAGLITRIGPATDADDGPGDTPESPGDGPEGSDVADGASEAPEGQDGLLEDEAPEGTEDD